MARSSIPIDRLMEQVMARSGLGKERGPALASDFAARTYGIRIDCSPVNDTLVDAPQVLRAVGRLPKRHGFVNLDAARRVIDPSIASLADAFGMIERDVFPRKFDLSDLVKWPQPDWRLHCKIACGPFERLPRPKRGSRPWSVRANDNVTELFPLEGRARNQVLASLGFEIPSRGIKVFDIESEPRCPLKWPDDDLRAVLENRADYIAWHQGLCELVTLLQTGTPLVEHDPLPPSAPPRPWIRAAGAVLTAEAPSLSPERDALTQLPLQPKRHAPDKPIESEIERKSREWRRRRRRAVIETRDADRM